MKKRRILIAGGALLLSAFAACEPYLSLDEALTGKSCAETQPRCAPGYVCGSDNTCVLGSVEVESPPLRPDPTGGADGGVGGGSSEGAAGAGAEPAGNAGASSMPQPTLSAGAGGMPGSAGAGAVADAGTVEPGPEPGEADAGCTPVQLYPDRDGDGFGTDEGSIVGCLRDGFASESGDCFDESPRPGSLADDVFPGQQAFFGAAYPTPAGDSFDYDCDEQESVAPQFVPISQVPDCSQFESSCNNFRGYLPTERTGPAQNPVCGSIRLVLCVGVAGAACEESEVPRATDPVLCN